MRLWTTHLSNADFSERLVNSPNLAFYDFYDVAQAFVTLHTYLR
jgi:hypothetical protein